MMTTMTLKQAMSEYGDALNIAATAAIEKKGRSDEVRVIYDGSNGIDLNPGIRVRDQIRYPTAADAKVVVGSMADEGGAPFPPQVRRPDGTSAVPRGPRGLGLAGLPDQGIGRVERQGVP